MTVDPHEQPRMRTGVIIAVVVFSVVATIGAMIATYLRLPHAAPTTLPSGPAPASPVRAR